MDNTLPSLPLIPPTPPTLDRSISRLSLTGDRCLYIGIDFGTTYSGVAWAWSGDPDNIHEVTNWKTIYSRTADNAKAPTEIYYNRSSVSWGYDIPADQEPLRWFKLLLLKDQDVPEDIRRSPYFQRAKQSLKQSRKTAVEVVSDYLRELWSHAIASIKRERGSSSVDGLPFKVVLTVPAIWKPYAQTSMITAAKMAGILDRRLCGETTLHLISEPEAAALAALAEFKGRRDIKPGDVFIICDAGGGTADLISYKIESTNPLALDECVEGKGKLAGAIFVDEKFQNAIRAKLGERWNNLSPAVKKKLMNDEWEYGIKRLYNENDRNRTWNVQLPPEAFIKKHAFGRNTLNDRFTRDRMPMVNGQIQLQQGHIRGFFAGVVGDIRGLVREQIRKVHEQNDVTLKGIILVGGFGSCNYLYDLLDKEYGETMDIIQPRKDGPWTAICRGAVIGARANVVKSRVSRYSYGIMLSEFYDQSNPNHYPEDRIYDNDFCEYMVENQMKWYIRRGESLHTTAPVKLRRSFLRDKPFPNNIMGISLFYHSDDDDPTPPARRTPKVSWLCSIKCHIETPFEEIPVWTNPKGRVLRCFTFTVEVSSLGTSLDFAIVMDGRRLGEKNVKVQFDEISQRVLR